MTDVVYRYKRVLVENGKHGPGDFRVTFNGAAPTHGEMLAMLWWIFRAEQRYIQGHGSRLLWWLVRSVYEQDFPLEDLVRQADGSEEAE